MRLPFGSCLLALLVASAGSAASLEEARLRWLKGNYEEAQSGYEELVKDARTRTAASIGLSHALQSQGEYDRALTVIDAALQAAPKHADLLARRAELLHLRGRWDEAAKAADAALAANDRHLLARWVRAQVFRDRGETKAADAEVKRIVRLYSEGVNTPNEIKDPESLTVVGMASAENARWNGLADEFQAILEDLYGDAIKFDKTYWPAEWQAGVLLLEKYNRGEALDAFDKALAINPSASEVLAAKGMAALMRFEFKDAERLAEQALKFNPRLPDALRLRADVHLGTGDSAAALKELAEARKVNPRDARTLGRIAACHLVRGEKKEFAAVVAEAEGYDRAPAAFYGELADRLEDRRRYDLAEQYYQKAVKARPELSGPINALGLLYMRLGKEKEAAELLEKGFKADRFNVRVSNMRKVLQHLNGYKELKTAHFVVKYDPKTDAVLARYVADYLERIYDELAAASPTNRTGRSWSSCSATTTCSAVARWLPDLHDRRSHRAGGDDGVAQREDGARRAGAQPFNWAGAAA
ncbi:MAG: tetratricopeptide repeat protein [Gemmataceae bacterium]